MLSTVRRRAASTIAAHGAAFNPNDGSRVFASRSTLELLRSAFVFRAASSGVAVSALCAVLRRVSEARAGSFAAVVGAPINAMVRRGVFPMFCAGEDMDSCKSAAARLTRAGQGLRVILDHSTEEQEDAAAWDGNLVAKCALLKDAAEALPGQVAFVPIKPTALFSPALLETMTAAIVDMDEVEVEVDGQHPPDPTSRLSEADQALLRSGVERLESLCAAAEDAGVPLLLDAEQSHRQPAIDFLARGLARRFNSRSDAEAEADGVRRTPVVYNTFQMYLDGKGETLARELSWARQGGYVLAAKVVRGAYVTAERERSRALGGVALLQPSKAATDEAYDAAVRSLLEATAADGSAAIVVATHNARSIARAVEGMEELDIPRDDAQVHLAQIFGMCDHLTFALAQSGYNALKLVPFGAYGDVLPWLLRRLEENQDALGATQQERPVLEREIRRRLVG